MSFTQTLVTVLIVFIIIHCLRSNAMEAIVLFAILGIFASIAVPNMIKYNDNKGMKEIKAVPDAIDNYFAESLPDGCRVWFSKENFDRKRLFNPDYSYTVQYYVSCCDEEGCEGRAAVFIYSDGDFEKMPSLKYMQ